MDIYRNIYLISGWPEGVGLPHGIDIYEKLTYIGHFKIIIKIGSQVCALDPTLMKLFQKFAVIGIRLYQPNSTFAQMKTMNMFCISVHRAVILTKVIEWWFSTFNWC